MKRVWHDDAVVLEFDEQVFRVAESAGSPARRGLFDDRPELLEPAADTGAARLLAQALVRRGVIGRAGVTINLAAGPAAPEDTRRAMPPALPTRLTVPLGPEEQAVVLVEGDGVLAWRYGREVAPSGSRDRRGEPAARVLVFDIDVPPVAAPVPGAAPGQRGWLRDRLVEGAKAIVLYFAAQATAAGVVRLAERGTREGPVIVRSASDAAQWSRPDDLAGLRMPADRRARILLLVHGTFSSTLGAFGELTATPWGRKLLAAALERYDAVIGYDHRTLSKTPLENANDLLAALRTLDLPSGAQVDAVCHSRGGLVLRSLIERLLPEAGLDVKVPRAVFAAATNHGTELARPDNWESLLDLVTNLAAVTGKVISMFPDGAVAAAVTDEVVSCIGEFVKYLVEVAVKERRVPGIAAMDPAGAFVRDLNLTQAGQPGPREIDCFAVVSDFEARLFGDGSYEPAEFPRRLAFVLADGVVDRLMRGDGSQPVPNDLVVDVPSMTDIDASVGGFVKDVLDFGRNPLVYHTNYFLRPETVGRVAQWLSLPSPLEGVDPLILAGAANRVLRVRADAQVAEVRALVGDMQPDFLVVTREDPTSRAHRLAHYAVQSKEFLDAAHHAGDHSALIQVLDLRETDRSRDFDLRSVPFDGSSIGTQQSRMHARRGVVLDRGRPTAVLDADFHAADALGLVELARRMVGTVRARPPASRSGTGPDVSLLGGGAESSRGVQAEPVDEPWSTGAQPPKDLPPAPQSSSEPTPVPLPGAPVTAPEPESAPESAPESESESESAQAKPPVHTARAKPRPAHRELHAMAEMPGEVALHRDAIVTVTISAEQIDAAAAGQASERGRFDAVLAEKLDVHVIARRGFDYSPEDPTHGRAQVDPPAKGEPAVLDFTLIANEAGDGEISVAIRQAALRKLMLTLRPRVVDPREAPGRTSVAATATLDTEVDCGPCASLEIFDRRNAGQLQYEFILRAGDVYDRFCSAPIQVEPRTYVDDCYNEIEQAWLDSGRAIERFAKRLEAMGGQMFRRLFPLPLQQALWRLAVAGSLDGILVHSDEPFLPWEIVFLDDPERPAATGAGRFLGELGLCRWLYGSSPVCSITVRRGAARYVIPHYPRADIRLAGAETVEEPMLRDELHASAVLPAHHAEVLDLLQHPGSVDLLHFACHGKADPQHIDSAALLLEGEVFQSSQGAMWSKESLLASTVEQFADLRSPDGSRPLVVVNACQTGRLGYSLTGMGGFATAFLGTREGSGDSRGRAGAFIGALWSVGDDTASTFVTELYRSLKAGRRMFEASREARKASRGAGEGSWLAYAVYAHPNLQVRFE